MVYSAKDSDEMSETIIPRTKKASITGVNTDLRRNAIRKRLQTVDENEGMVNKRKQVGY